MTTPQIPEPADSAMVVVIRDTWGPCLWTRNDNDPKADGDYRWFNPNGGVLPWAYITDPAHSVTAVHLVHAEPMEATP